MPGFTLQSPTVRLLLSALLEAGEATDSQLVRMTDRRRASVCAARIILQNRGLVEWTGRKDDIPTGQPPKIWALTDAGRQEAQRGSDGHPDP
jgi:hypothetical protein